MSKLRRVLRKLNPIRETARCKWCGEREYKEFMVRRFWIGWFCNEEEISEFLDKDRDL